MTGYGCGDFDEFDDEEVRAVVVEESWLDCD
jgi:hypothetical protein